MNKLSKKMALALSLAVVTSTVAGPVAPASAASKITLKSGAAAPSTIYASHSYNLQVKGVKVKFYSSNKKVATVGLTTGKLKAVAPGTVKVTAKNAKSGKAVASASFKVLQRAKSVAVDNAELYLNANDTATIKATKTPATSTDVVRFYSADKTIVKVGATSGKVTAVKNGKTTIKVYSKATKATSNSSKNNKVTTVNVFVGPCLDTVAQTKTNKLTLNFKTDMKDVKVSDISIINDTTKATVAVKEVKVDATDAKKVTVETFGEMKDGKTYTVTFGDTSAQFTATDGVVAKLSVDPVVIPYETETEVKLLAMDANGIVVKEVGLDNKEDQYSFTVKTTSGYTTSNKLYLSKKGDTAIANGTYHTYKYENGQEVGAITTGDVTITAGDKEVVTLNKFDYTVSKDAVDWKKVTKTNTTVAKDEEGLKVYFNFKDSKGKEIENYSDYKVESSDKNKLIVNSLNGKYAEIRGVNEGTAYILVKDSKDNVVASLPITIGAKKANKSFSLSKYDIVLSHSAQANETAKVQVKVKDNYDADVKAAAGDVTIECTSTDAKGVTKEEVNEGIGAIVTYSEEKGELTFVGAVPPVGKYNFKITVKGLGSQTITVNFKEPDTKLSASYNIRLSKETADANVTKKEEADNTIDIQFAETRGDVLVRYPEANIKVYDKDNKEVDSKYFSDGKFYVTTVVDGTVQKAPAGTYTVKVSYTTEDKKEINRERTFTVKDSQTELVAILKKEKLDGNYTEVKDVLNDAVLFSYDGKEYGFEKDDKIEIVEADTEIKTITGSGVVYFEKVTALVTIDGVKVPVKANFGKSITVDYAKAVASEAPASSAPAEDVEKE